MKCQCCGHSANQRQDPNKSCNFYFFFKKLLSHTVTALIQIKSVCETLQRVSVLFFKKHTYIDSSDISNHDDKDLWFKKRTKYFEISILLFIFRRFDVYLPMIQTN